MQIIGQVIDLIAEPSRPVLQRPGRLGVGFGDVLRWLMLRTIRRIRCCGLKVVKIGLNWASDRSSQVAWMASGVSRLSQLASACTVLPSTNAPVPPTRPFAVQSCTTISKTCRRTSPSEKRPCRFLENVDRSGTRPSSPRRQNHCNRRT